MEGKIDALYKGFNVIKNGGLILAGIAVFLMMGFIVVDVLLRNVFSASLSGSYEIIQRYLMPLAVFPAIAITYSSGLMPKITMFVEKLSGKVQYIINLFLLFLEIFVMILIFYYSWRYAIQGLQAGVTFPAGGKMYPLYPVLFLVPLGFALLTIELVFNIIKELMKKPFSSRTT
ncbi:TRAP transporter small permease [Alkalihalobacterium elongatum]|uniref:TRAP transporter small permease n=1 Tax=Alkalihalobacterium elongatum TaxID=2675466 RepID=UPI001C1FF0DA|nr:TRAP transporter small permease [Alkalihalobacterium elongatum]